MLNTKEKIAGALIHLSEKQMFFPEDEETLSSMTRFFIKYGHLTEKQVNYAKTKLQKYQILSKEQFPSLPFKQASSQAPAAIAKTVDLEKGTMIIKFPYESAIVEAVKMLEGRKWDSATKTWTAPLNTKSIEKLMSHKFAIDNQIMDWYNNQKPGDIKPISDIPGLNAVLRPFQTEGVAFTESRKGRVLIADDMGLGKTIQAIAWLQLHPENRPAIVVCPASVKEAWARSASKWMKKETIIIIDGKPKNKNEVLPKASIYILNYDIIGNKSTFEVDENTGKKKRVDNPFTGWIDFLCDIEPNTVVVDEAHYCKNEKSNRTVGVRKLAKVCKHAIFLTGTPIQNKPAEFWPVLNMCSPNIFKNFFKFACKYCCSNRDKNGNAKRGHFGWDFTGSYNEQELSQLLRETIMIRRLKKDVLKELPQKVRGVVPLALSHSDYKKYISVEQEIEEWMASDDATKGAAMIRVEKLKQEAVRLKMNQAISWIEDFLDTEEKLILFCEHKETVDTLLAHFTKLTTVAHITGQTKGSRQDQVDKFQNDPACNLFVGSSAAKEGVTLTASSNVAFLELWWKSTDHDQAEDRALRIGQESESMNSWYLIAANTIEEEIALLLDKKREVINATVDGRQVEDFDLLTVLMGKMTNRKIKHP